MRKVMFQALAIASLLGMSAVSVSASTWPMKIGPLAGMPGNHGSDGALNKTMGDFNTRGGNSGSGGAEQQAAMAPVSSNTATYPVPNRLSPQPFRPAGRWMDWIGDLPLTQMLVQAGKVQMEYGERAESISICHEGA